MCINNCRNRPNWRSGCSSGFKNISRTKKLWHVCYYFSCIAKHNRSKDVLDLPVSVITAQLDAVIEDIPVHALKTGMIANVDMMKEIKQRIELLNIAYVMDPVMVTTSGDTLINEEA